MRWAHDGGAVACPLPRPDDDHALVDHAIVVDHPIVYPDDRRLRSHRWRQYTWEQKGVVDNTATDQNRTFIDDRCGWDHIDCDRCGRRLWCGGTRCGGLANGNADQRRGAIKREQCFLRRKRDSAGPRGANGELS